MRPDAPWAASWGQGWLGLIRAAPFEAILVPKVSPNDSQNGVKINEKSIQKSSEFLVGFLIGFGMVLGRCLEGFWDPGSSKMSFWCRRGAIFKKFTFLVRFVFGAIFY